MVSCVCVYVVNVGRMYKLSVLNGKKDFLKDADFVFAGLYKRLHLIPRQPAQILDAEFLFFVGVDEAFR